MIRETKTIIVTSFSAEEMDSLVVVVPGEEGDKTMIRKTKTITTIRLSPEELRGLLREALALREDEIIVAVRNQDDGVNIAEPPFGLLVELVQAPEPVREDVRG